MRMAKTLQQRLDRVRAAMNAHMWSPSAGLYANTLFNGTQLGVFAPTSVFPMLSGAASDAQAEALAGALACPLLDLNVVATTQGVNRCSLMSLPNSKPSTTAGKNPMNTLSTKR